MRLLCLCNARAGGKGNQARALRDLLAPHPAAQLVFTDSAAHMASAVADFDASPHDLIAVHGGDGSLQALLSLLAQRLGEGRPSPRLAVLPGGSTNMSARDINQHHRWVDTAKALARVVADSGSSMSLRARPVLRIQGEGAVRAGFFLGAGAVVEGIDYCNRRLWDEGAARRELTAGFAMARTMLGVLRGEAPFDAPLPIALLARAADGEEIRLVPSTGATVLAASTLDRLLVGARPHWGEEQGAVRFTVVERSARLLRHLAGLVGLPGAGRPAAAAGYHSHNCAELEVTLGGDHRAVAPASYAIDGEIFEAPSTALVIDGEWAPEFVLL